MIEQQSLDRLFSTPLFRFKVQDHETLSAALLEEGQKMREASEGISRSNRNGWHSEGNLFSSEADCVKTLRNHAETAVWAATEKVSRKVDKASLAMKLFAWMNANPAGGYNAPHTHPGAHWSGVYYVSQPEIETGNSGMIEFLDPRSDLPNWRILKAQAFRPKHKVRPKAGEIVLFPSYLVHWVYPNEANEDRVTIAFNATFRRAKGT